jgi:hypothetical protein
MLDDRSSTEVATEAGKYHLPSQTVYTSRAANDNGYLQNPESVEQQSETSVWPPHDSLLNCDVVDSGLTGSAQLWQQDDIDRLLLDLQQSLPDVGRLFDGSIGQFSQQNSLTGFLGADIGSTDT